MGARKNIAPMEKITKAAAVISYTVDYLHDRWKTSRTGRSRAHVAGLDRRQRTKKKKTMHLLRPRAAAVGRVCVRVLCEPHVPH